MKDGNSDITGEEGMFRSGTLSFLGFDPYLSHSIQTGDDQ
jgi:hypothetical protein